MALPASFARDGFVTPDKARSRMKLPNGRLLKPLMIGTEGESDTGKSEFILSCPGPGIVICVDRGMDPLFDNPRPPEARRDDFGIKYIKVPMNDTAAQSVYTDYYKQVRTEYYKALDNTDALTVAMDGDSDFYELQVLAEFGKTKQVWPQTRWSDVYTKKRAITARSHDSGKIIIATNKLKDEYETVYNPDGTPVKEGNDDKRIKTGRKERQGYKDQNYLWNIQIRHLFKPAHTSAKGKEVAAQWGIKILKCKSDTELVGLELWGEDCNFRGLVQTVYPQTPIEEWGLKP